MAGRKSKTSVQSSSPAVSTAQRIATVGGLGRIPLAPGTVGSLVGVALCVPLLRFGWPLQMAAAVALCGVAFAVCGRAAAELGHPDPPQVVIDEIAGMAVAMVALPLQWYDLGAVFLLFRLFDVVKPAPIPRLEGLGGGVGIVADDIAAGALARVTWWLLQANFDFL